MTTLDALYLNIQTKRQSPQVIHIGYHKRDSQDPKEFAVCAQISMDTVVRNKVSGIHFEIIQSDEESQNEFVTFSNVLTPLVNTTPIGTEIVVTSGFEIAVDRPLTPFNVPLPHEIYLNPDLTNIIRFEPDTSQSASEACCGEICQALIQI